MKRGAIGHGPYWYEYWWEGGKTRKRYWGRKRPAREDFRADEQREREHKGEARTSYDRARIRHAEDLGLLGLGEGFTSVQLRRAYKQVVFAAHPDRGGSHERMVAINAAYARVRATME